VASWRRASAGHTAFRESSLNLPLGASIASRYQASTPELDATDTRGQEIVDGTQIVFPDVVVAMGRAASRTQIDYRRAWAERARPRDAPVQWTQPLFGEIVDDPGNVARRSYPMNGSLVFAAHGRLTTSDSRCRSGPRLQPGLSSNGDNSDFSIDVSKAWKLPTD